MCKKEFSTYMSVNLKNVFEQLIMPVAIEISF
jgi:hypothetical protein